MNPFGTAGYLNLSSRNLYVISENIKKEIDKKFDSVSVVFSNNSFHEVPIEIKNLPFSEYLDFSSNNLEDVKNLKYFNFLTYLDLSNNKLFDIPIELCSLKSLKNLKLSNNRIKKIPDQISELKNIEEFSVDCNLLDNFNENICKLKTLIYLNLRKNRIATIPNGIELMTSLCRLDLSFNMISNLDSEIYKLNRLKELIIDGNPIIFPPLYICSMGIKAIMAHLRKSSERRVDVILKTRKLRPQSINFLNSCLKNHSVDLETSPIVTKQSDTVEEIEDSTADDDDEQTKIDTEFVRMILAEKKIISLEKEENIFQFLSNGIYLCKLLKAYNHPVSVIFLPSSREMRLSKEHSIKNIEQFLKGCEKVGVKPENSSYTELILSGKYSKKVLNLIVQFIKASQPPDVFVC